MNNKKKDNIALAAVTAALIAALCAFAARGETTEPTARAVVSLSGGRADVRMNGVGHFVHYAYGYAEKVTAGTFTAGRNLLCDERQIAHASDIMTLDLNSPDFADCVLVKLQIRACSADCPCSCLCTVCIALGLHKFDIGVWSMTFERVTTKSRWRILADQSSCFERVPRGGAVIVK